MSNHALTDFSFLSKLVLKGPDRKKFLQGLTTNDILALKPLMGQRSCLLSPKGKLQADFALYDLGEELLILCWPKAGENFKGVLSKMILLSQSCLEDAGSRFGLLHLAGPGAFSICAQLFKGISSFEPYQAQTVQWGGEKVLLLSYPILSPEGVLVLAEAGKAAPLSTALLGAGFQDVGWEALNVLRVERGVPLFGLDMDEDTIPLEARLDEAISFTKGCYMGQETISRIHHMGHVNRILVRIKLSENSLPPGGSPVLSADKEIGRTASAVFSPRHQAPLTLAMIRVGESRPGTRVDVAIKDRLVPAEVL
ncbi:MAG: aminomethyl transferase family protein [Elusimicrobia bacterium]|nr:aminomethyl transferase family protein [Elusimicrobiota bacterium]